jgi:hypothetical protein
MLAIGTPKRFSLIITDFIMQRHIWNGPNPSIFVVFSCEGPSRLRVPNLDKSFRNSLTNS